MPAVTISNADLDALQNVRNELPRTVRGIEQRAALTRILNAGGLA